MFDVQQKQMIDNFTAEEIRDLLKLEPHATCGFVRVTFISEKRIAAGGLPPPFADGRPTGSALYFMVTPDAPVRLHRIRALTDAHLWAEIFDRKLTDIFAVESEIAKTAAETLQARLTGSEKNSIAKTPTVNPEAYELYLKEKFFAEKRTGADLRKSSEYYDQAIAKDPDYPLAYVGLADSHLLLSVYGGRLARTEAGSGDRQ